MVSGCSPVLGSHGVWSQSCSRLTGCLSAVLFYAHRVSERSPVRRSHGVGPRHSRFTGFRPSILSTQTTDCVLWRKKIPIATYILYSWDTVDVFNTDFIIFFLNDVTTVYCFPQLLTIKCEISWWAGSLLFENYLPYQELPSLPSSLSLCTLTEFEHMS